MSHETLPVLFALHAEDLQVECLTSAREAAALGWLVIWPNTVGCADDQRDRLIETYASLADGLLVSGEGKACREAQKQIERLAHHYRVPVYSTTPVAGAYPARRQLVAPPFYGEWSKAAQKVRLSTYDEATDDWTQAPQDAWSCATCQRFCGSGEHGERMARWCCVKRTPCDTCGAMTDKTWRLCDVCRELGAVTRYEKRERRPAGDHMVYSDRDDRWFTDVEDAEEHALELILDDVPENKVVCAERLREELVAMRLLTCEPVCVGAFDLGEHVSSDDLPGEDSGGDPNEVFRSLEAHVKEEVVALNAKLASFPPLSYQATNYAVLLENPAFAPRVWTAEDEAKVAAMPKEDLSFLDADDAK